VTLGVTGSDLEKERSEEISSENSRSSLADLTPQAPSQTRENVTPSVTKARDGGRDGRRFNSTDLGRLFSEERKARGLGSYRLQHSDYDRAQLAVEWANEDHPSAPAEACRLSIQTYLEHATGKPAADGYPFWGWALDPAAWHARATSSPQAAARAARPEVAKRRLEELTRKLNSARAGKREAHDAGDRAAAQRLGLIESQTEREIVELAGPTYLAQLEAAS